MSFDCMKHKFQLHHIPVAVLMILVLGISTSCGLKPEDSTVLQDTSCSPPCWHQIIPGKSTKQEVLAILQSLPEVDSSSISDALFPATDNSVYWKFYSDVGDSGGRITFLKDTASVITLLHKKDALTVEEAVNKFGDPEEILARFREGGERTWLSVYLFYSSKGYTLLFTVVPFDRGDPARISPYQSLDATWYFDPILFETIMTSGPIDRLRPEVLKQDVQLWTGYGDITYVEDDQK